MSDYFEKAAITWDDDPNRRLMAETIADAMLRRLNPTGTEVVLDYGAGTGNIALQMVLKVKKIIAADSAKEMLAILQEKLTIGHIRSIEPKEWSIGQDMKDLPTFDIITVSMALHHVMDTREAVRVFHALLSGGGKIAIADLDPDNGEFHEPGIAEHDGFDRDDLKEILKNTGFSEIMFEDVAIITRTSSKNGKPRDFSLFLVTAQKR